VGFHVIQVDALTGNLDDAVNSPDQAETPLIQPLHAIGNGDEAMVAITIHQHPICASSPTLEQLKSTGVLARCNACCFSGSMHFDDTRAWPR